MDELIQARVVLVKDAAVVVLLLGVGSVDGEALSGSCKLLVRDLRLAHALQLRHPVHAHPLALHGLSPPQHRLRHLALEEGAQCPLLWPLIGDHLEGRAHSHDGVDDIWVQEGHPALQGVGHGHAVCTLAVDVVQMPEDPAELLEKGLLVGCVTEVQVATKELIAALAGQNHFHVAAGQAGEEVVGDGGADELGLVGLEVVDYFLHHGKCLLRLEEVLLVVGAQMLSHHAGGGHVWRALLTDGVGEHLLAPLVQHLLEQHCHNGAVQTTAQQQAKGHI
mmetsp:Transcript_28750/g.80953  ORF Transcript_28750/g.80953 Transcript_28750/m.80953 type:complete len:278 (+) Transcript_28750:363-1196(+)